MEKRHRRTSPLFLLILLVLVAGLAALFIFGGEEKQPASVKGDATKRYLMEGGLEWNGRLYRPRSDVTSILLFGISHMDPEAEPSADEGVRQVSFAQLMLVDHGAKTVHRIPVDTEQNAPVHTETKNGKTVVQQGRLAQAAAAGDGKDQSCQYVVEAVEALLPVGGVDFYVAVEADNMQDLLQIAAGIANAAMPEAPAESGRLMSRRARAELQSQQMAQLLAMITQISSADEQQINALLDAMAPYVITDMPRGRMINEVWQIKPYLQLDKVTLPAEKAEAERLCMELFYQPVQ